MPTEDAVSKTPKYLIGKVTKLTGLSVDVLRVWERRYGAVRPVRSEGGTRLYSDADIKRLKRLRQAVDGGHSIGQAARLSESELDELIADGEATREVADPYRAARERFIDAITDMDVVGADQQLAHAATLHPAHELIKRIIAPALDEIGERRAHKELGVAQERLALGLVRNMVGSLFRLYPPSKNRKTMVLAAPAGAVGETELLLEALLAAAHGWCVVFLGASVPAPEIALAVRMTNAAVLVLSLTEGVAEIGEELASLARLIPFPTRVWISGSEAARQRELVSRANWILVRDLDELDARLDD